MVMVPGATVFFERAAVKESVPTRLACGANVTLQAPQSPLYPLPDVKLAMDLLIQDTSAVQVALDAHTKALGAFVKARTALGAALGDWDDSLDILVAVGRKHCVTADDGVGLGLPVLLAGPTKYAFAMPLGIQARIDVARNDIVARVLKAKGMRAAVTQMSADPVTPTSWKDLDGYGLLQRIPMPAPGLYWLRAAHRRARVTSEFTAPVPILVK
jgi:hypothetical protein